MVARFRTLRWLAALLLIASPAVGGQLMPLLHPCAVESAATDSHHGHGGDHQQQAPDGAQCSCIGSCQAPAVVTPPATTTLTSVVGTLPVGLPRITDRRNVTTVSRPIDRLPPPTAPPVA
jgi:hypothetical protein